MKNKEIVRSKVIEILKTVLDPEINLSIWDMGLIYNIELKGRILYILMTLTSPSCPFADDIFEQIRISLGALSEIDHIEIELTFEPPWSLDSLTEEGKLEMGIL